MINIDQIKQSFEQDIKAITDVESLKVKYLGRKQGLLTLAFKELVNLDQAQRQKLGPLLNSLKKEIENAILNLEKQSASSSEKADLTVPPISEMTGMLHPLSKTQKDLEDIFLSLGFTVENGPEIESDYNNFVALNFPDDHPARDMQDTFYIKGPETKDPHKKLVMRTHTSPVQVRFMKTHKPPFAIIVPGTVYRNEATDVTHEYTLTQLEGLVVGEDVNFANMVWTLDYVLKKYFGSDIKTKILPTYFPFVEPGAELAMSSPRFKDGKWVEMLGCGMVHQNVFKHAGYQTGKYQGFAFGFGTMRFPLMKHGIPDIRLLHENNLQFLSQF